MISDTPNADIIKKLRDYAVISYNDLKNIYPKLCPTDPRIAVMSNIKSIISSVMIMGLCYDENIKKHSFDWWQKNGFINKDKEIEDYIMLNGWCLIIFPFSLFESGIRQIIRRMNIQTIKRDNFQHLCEKFFDHLGKLSFVEPKQFIDVYRHTRNTIHNNGIFYDKKDENPTWRGIEYSFKRGQHRDFKIEHCILLVNELINLTLEIMKHNTIKNLSLD